MLPGSHQNTEPIHVIGKVAKPDLYSGPCYADGSYYQRDCRNGLCAKYLLNTGSNFGSDSVALLLPCCQLSILAALALHVGASIMLASMIWPFFAVNPFWVSISSNF